MLDLHHHVNYTAAHKLFESRLLPGVGYGNVIFGVLVTHQIVAYTENCIIENSFIHVFAFL